jgi:hypothetical protein
LIVLFSAVLEIVSVPCETPAHGPLGLGNMSATPGALSNSDKFLQDGLKNLRKKKNKEFSDSETDESVEHGDASHSTKASLKQLAEEHNDEVQQRVTCAPCLPV